MTFTYKLAQRLARLKDHAAIVATVAVAMIVGCELPVRSTDPGSTIAQLVIAPKNVTLQPSQAYDFVAVGFTANGDSADESVSWSATDGSVTSSSSGKRHYGHYHNANCGVSKVVATSNPGNLSDTATVTVAGCTVPVATVSVSPASATVAAGQAIQLSATPKDANGNPLTGRTVTWSSSNTSVAIADVNGNVTALAPGSATITATSEGQSGTAAITVTSEGKTGTSAITVTSVPVASVTVSPASPTVTAGQTVQLTATPKDANGNQLTGRTITWSSSNTSVATVSSGGLVSGVVAGSATITATSEGQSGTAAITVTNVSVASVTVSPAPASVVAGQTVQLTATPKDANGNALTGRVVTWSSSNTSVATVNGSGLVSGVVAGSATITATSEGQSGTSAITVTGPAPGCATSTTAFQNSAFTSQNGSFTATFDATPNGAGLVAGRGGCLYRPRRHHPVQHGRHHRRPQRRRVRRGEHHPLHRGHELPLPHRRGCAESHLRGVRDPGRRRRADHRDRLCAPDGAEHGNGARQLDAHRHHRDPHHLQLHYRRQYASGAGRDGDADAGVAHGERGPDAAAHGHAEGRQRQHPHGTLDHLVEQQHLGSERERDWARDGCAGRVGDDHGDERGTERDIGRHGRAHAGRLGDGDAGVGHGIGGEQCPAHRHAQGRERQSAGGPDRHMAEQQHVGRDRQQQRARHGGRRRVGDDHGDE